MTLHFVESGKGPAVVLLHAFPVDCLLWASARKALAGAGYLAITPDLPGFGGSPQALGEPSLDYYADEVTHLLDHLNVAQATVVGLSMGGYVAMNMLRRSPQRLSGVVLVDTKPGQDTEPARQNRLAIADRVEAGWPLAELAATMLPNLLGETTRRANPQLGLQVGRWITAQDPRAIAYAQRAMAARPDSSAEIAAYSGPVLVVRGVEDTISSAEEAAAMVGQPSPRRQLVEIPGAGHLSAVENPQAVDAALLNWLGGHAQREEH